MATVSTSQPRIWQPPFDAAEQLHNRAEDDEAFSTVTGILMAVVSAGLLLGALSVLIVLALG